MSTRKSKIPVKKYEPLFRIVSDLEKTSDGVSSRGKRSKSSRKESKMRTYSADQLHHRNGSVEMITDDEKFKELLSTIASKDNQIRELIERHQSLASENERLKREKIILVDNYNALYGKYENENLKNRNQFNNMKSNTKNFPASDESNDDMKNDIKMLKILVFRLNKHLEYYQDLLRENHIKPVGTLKLFENMEMEMKWGAVNSHVLAPLLNSYEERIQEKNDLIASYEDELNNITGKLKEILVENEKAHELHDTLRKNSDAWLQERQRLLSCLEIVKNKATVQSKRADLAKEKLVEIMKAYEQKVASQSIDIERLQEAYNRAKGEIATLKSYQKNPEVVVESIKECQKLFEELKSQYEHEKLKFNDERNRMESQLSKQTEKFESLEKDYYDLKTLSEKQKVCNETLNEKNRALKQNLHKYRQSNDQLQNDLDFGKDKYKESWNNLSKLHEMIQEKEITIQNMRINQRMEVEELKRKLQQRDQTLKKVLEAKISSTKSRQQVDLI